MENGELIAALFIGITLSILFAEVLGILPAGMIVPSFVALVFDQPAVVIGMFTIAILSFFCVRFLSKHILLYGRRKFGAMIIVSLLLKLALTHIFRHYLLDYFVLGGIGIIVPGLIANSFDRQGILPTIASVLLLGSLTYVGVLIYLILL